MWEDSTMRRIPVGLVVILALGLLGRVHAAVPLSALIVQAQEEVGEHVHPNHATSEVNGSNHEY
jgi:hypothetical protein